MLYLKAHRKAAGLTQQNLAERTRLSMRAISKLEADGDNPTLRSLQALSDALGVTIPDLLAPPKRNGRKRKAS